MDKKIAKAWVKALRSGHYKQGRRQLRNDNDEFCCLGVLCNLHAQAHPDFAADQKYRTAYQNAFAHPPRAVSHWAGVRDGGSFLDGKNHDSLIALNDLRGKSFKEIADVIEANYKAL